MEVFLIPTIEREQVMAKKETAMSYEDYVREENLLFVQGSRCSSRKEIAKRLARIVKFKGGYMAAYRAVKVGYRIGDLYIGSLYNGKYGTSLK